jgi:hypothetical protein
MIPKSGVRFSDKIMRRKGRRSAERRMPTIPAHTDKRRRSPMLQSRLRAIIGGAPAFRRFTAALATGYYPMAQPQNRVSSRRGAKVFCLFAADALS